MTNLELEWHAPIRLVDDDDVFYSCPDFDDVPNTPGIYVFARVRGRICEPIYIGIAGRLRNRIAQHLNSTKLMHRLRNVTAGRRVLMIGQLIDLPRRDWRTVLASVERALIRQAVAEGWPITNKHGRVRIAYALRNTGNREARSWLPRELGLERVKRRARGRLD